MFFLPGYQLRRLQDPVTESTVGLPKGRETAAEQSLRKHQVGAMGS
jgi:hypothetical protein